MADFTLATASQRKEWSNKAHMEYVRRSRFAPYIRNTENSIFQGYSDLEKPASEFQGNVWSRSMAARFPDDWREVKGTELTGKDGAPIQTANNSKIDVAGLNDEQLRALASIRIPTE